MNVRIVRCLALLAVGVYGQTSSDSAIQALLDRLAQAENRRDTVAQRELVAESAELPTFPERRPFDERGPASYKIERIRLIGSDVAVVDASRIFATSAGGPVSVPVLFVLKQTREVWRIALYHMCFNDPARSRLVP